MLQKILIKQVLKLVFDKLLKKYNLDKIRDYVENDNELDIKVKDLEKRIKKLEKRYCQYHQLKKH